MIFLPEALKNLLREVFTRRYPKEKPVLPHGFRGKLMHYPEKCIYCGMCERNCPSNCIHVDNKKKVWSHDIGQCLFCEQCVETCHEMPKRDALVMGIEYEITTKDKRKLKWHSKPEGSSS
jgi:formate hydrogenlyase subunit 6/NADH:ubiquinone oxidoreductase subunit I